MFSLLVACLMQRAPFLERLLSLKWSSAQQLGFSHGLIFFEMVVDSDFRGFQCVFGWFSLCFVSLLLLFDRGCVACFAKLSPVVDRAPDPGITRGHPGHLGIRQPKIFQSEDEPSRASPDHSGQFANFWSQWNNIHLLAFKDFPTFVVIIIFAWSFFRMYLGIISFSKDAVASTLTW